MTPLTIEKVRELVRSRGPCITIFLPAFRPGAQTLHSTVTLIRNFLQEAGRKVDTPVLEPLRAMAANPKTDEGCHWARVIFRSPDVFETFLLREPAASQSHIGDRFHIVPLLRELELPVEFYVLKISRKDATLFRAQFSVQPLSLPATVPATVADFQELARRDHDLENRSSVGPSAVVGAGRRVRFGTASDEEKQVAYVADYYRAVDRALKELKGPLILEGVEEDTSLYHEVAAHAKLMDGSIRDGAPEQEKIEQGYAILRAAAAERSAKFLAEASERLAPARFTTQKEAIATGAAEGRVGRLFLSPGVDEETMNAAAVETIAHGGEAFCVPSAKITNGAMAAALRY